LRDYCIYANGFTPESKLVAWFWEIVLEEWNDSQRRKLLSFSTGSDRAPVNGLKAMKFFIVKDEIDDDIRLPSSHTCFN
jgi:HECT-domain (ubiquitin-transferase)